MLWAKSAQKYSFSKILLNIYCSVMENDLDFIFFYLETLETWLP